MVGYTWSLQYVSPLPSGIVETKLHPLTLSYDEVQKKLDALIDKTAGDVAAVPNPPRSLLGSETSASYVNRRNGLYVFSVAAVDEVGNIGPAAKTTILLDKYVPSTYITTINTVTDEFGTVTLSLYGGGYTYDGTITTIYIDKDGKAPYDRVLTMAGGGFGSCLTTASPAFAFRHGEGFVPHRTCSSGPRTVLLKTHPFHTESGTVKIQNTYDFMPDWAPVVIHIHITST